MNNDGCCMYQVEKVLISEVLTFVVRQYSLTPVTQGGPKLFFTDHTAVCFLADHPARKAEPFQTVCQVASSGVWFVSRGWAGRGGMLVLCSWLAACVVEFCFRWSLC